VIILLSLAKLKVLKFKTCSPMFPAAWVVHQRVLCFSLRLWIAHIIVMLQTCIVMKKLCSFVGSIYIHVAFSPSFCEPSALLLHPRQDFTWHVAFLLKDYV
jgi:hypothetical protein